MKEGGGGGGGIKRMISGVLLAGRVKAYSLHLPEKRVVRNNCFYFHC